jgi:hypothetical protein
VALLLLALLLGETLTGLYVANDVADVGPFTELVSPIADIHRCKWDVRKVPEVDICSLHSVPYSAPCRRTSSPTRRASPTIQ